MGSIQAVRPALHGLLVDQIARVDIGQRFQREADFFFFPLYPVSERLLYDPAARPLQALCQLIDALG